MNRYIRSSLTQVGFVAGIVGVVTLSGLGVYTVLADEGREIPDMPIHSYDIGDNAPRVVGWCFGSDAIYQANQSDGLAVVGNSANCAEGGILAEERP